MKNITANIQEIRVQVTRQNNLMAVWAVENLVNLDYVLVHCVIDSSEKFDIHYESQIFG